MSSEIVHLAGRYGRYGYSRVTGLLRTRGLEGQSQAGRADLAARRVEGAGPAAEAGPAVVQRRFLRATQAGPPNHVWAYDFVADRTYDGKAYRMLTVIDEFSRECLAIVVGRRIDSSDVL